MLAKRRWAFWLAIAAVLVGCRSPQPAALAPLAESPSPVQAADAAPSLSGTSWLAEDIGGRGVVDRIQSTLTFESDTRVVGSTACNSYFATLELAGTVLRITNAGSTRRACPPAVMDQETRFLAVLEAARGYRLDGVTNQMWLLGDGGMELTRFAQMLTAATEGQPGRGRVQQLLGTYTGTLPCADCSGIRTELSLYRGDDTYRLRETYLGTRDGDRTFESSGRWTVLRGNAAISDATIYQLNFDRPQDTRNFLRVSEEELRLLDRQQREIQSQASHVLRRTQSPRPGGYSPADATDPLVRAAADFAVAEQTRKTSQMIQLLAVSRAERQVVAGLNFRLCLNVNTNGAAQAAITVVYRNLQGQHSLTSWQAGPC